jgi:hypothetical protein
MRNGNQPATFLTARAIEMNYLSHVQQYLTNATLNVTGYDDAEFRAGQVEMAITRLQQLQNRLHAEATLLRMAQPIN